jgi:cytochrome c6
MYLLATTPANAKQSQFWQIRCNMIAVHDHRYRPSLGRERTERKITMSDIRKSTTNNLLVTFLATATFLGPVELGFGQAAGSSGPDIYKAKCVTCHAADGRGSAVGKSLHAADLHSPQVQQQSDAQLMEVIKSGRGSMPPFGDSLNEAQIASLVKYIRTFKTAK